MSPTAATTSSTPPASGPAWTDPLLANPHTVQDKARRVHEMFSAIAPSYDLNNRLHSLGMDQHWRSVAVKMARVLPTDVVVDVACGTGDLTKKLHDEKVKLAWATRMPARTIGVDFTYEMLPLAREKFRYWLSDEGRTKSPPRYDDSRPESGEDRDPAVEAKVRAQRANTGVHFVQGDALALPLPDGSADVISIAFGIRNVSDWGAAIDEFARVLKPGGRLIILEFSLPTNSIMRGLYNFYFRKIMPITATLISRDKSGAYKYLPESVNTFISRQAMQERMKAAGFGEIVARPLTFGICVCYKGVRRGNDQCSMTNDQ